MAAVQAWLCKAVNVLRGVHRASDAVTVFQLILRFIG
jgi:hypothetical protein